MTEKIKCIDNGAFLAGCDVIRLAKLAGYPMDGGLHRFIELACKDCDWDENEVFRAIFEDSNA